MVLPVGEVAFGKDSVPVQTYHGIAVFVLQTLPLNGSLSRCKNKYIETATYRREFKCVVLFIYGNGDYVIKFIGHKVK